MNRSGAVGPKVSREGRSPGLSRERTLQHVYGSMGVELEDMLKLEWQFMVNAVKFIDISLFRYRRLILTTNATGACQP